MPGGVTFFNVSTDRKEKEKRWYMYKIEVEKKSRKKSENGMQQKKKE